MQLLGCLLSIVLIILFAILGFGLSILSFILRLLGVNTSRTSFQKPETPQQPSDTPQTRVFQDNEGEYVDFEEV